jgi:hypothetical protein
MGRPQFTVRRLMIAVAIVAVSIFTITEASRLIRRAAHCRLWAMLHAGSEAHNLRMMAEEDARIARITSPDYRPNRLARFGFEPGSPEASLIPVIDPEPEVRRRSRYRELAGHHAVLAEKYERAYWRPWLAIEPDPPDPE